MDINDIQMIKNLIDDPIDGPYEGEDYFIDSDSIINVPIDKLKWAAKIQNIVNKSGVFDQRLVRIGQVGDCILLGFDTLVNDPPVHTAKIGPNKDVIIEAKKTMTNKLQIYINKKITIKTFKKISTVKKYIKALDQQLKQIVVEDINDKEYDDEEYDD